MTDTRFGPIPTRFEIVSSEEPALPLSFSMVSAVSNDGNDTNKNADKWLLQMPNGSFACIAPGFLTKNDDDSNNVRVGYVWMEIVNIGASHESKQNIEKDRIVQLLKRINSTSTASSDEADCRIWEQCANDNNNGSLWYTILFVLFMILMFVWIVLYTLSPHVDSKHYQTRKSKSAKTKTKWEWDGYIFATCERKSKQDK